MVIKDSVSRLIKVYLVSLLTWLSLIRYTILITYNNFPAPGNVVDYNSGEGPKRKCGGGGTLCACRKMCISIVYVLYILCVAAYTL